MSHIFLVLFRHAHLASCAYTPSQMDDTRCQTPSQLCNAIDQTRWIPSIGENRPHQVHVIDFSAACVYRFEQLINFLVTHLLTQIGENIAQLTDTDETGHIFVEDLKATAVFFRLARVLEAIWSVQNFGEGIVINCETDDVSLWLCNKSGRQAKKNSQSPPTLFSKSLISASVGF